MSSCPKCSGEVANDSRFCPHCGAPAAVPDGTMTAGPAPTPSTAPSDPSSLGHGRFEPGTKLGTRYRIVGMLGRGGMGEVYRADDLELGQSVALKLLPERVAADPAELLRFRNEVKVARTIAHPNVARIYDIGEADGHVFISMEYIDGEDMSSALRRMGRPSTDKALEISRQLCAGVAAAHDAGVLHRDLKPANVMIDGRGRVRITDFGLAGLIEELEGRQQLAGTPAYMAPEQLSGGSVSARSDVYSLGLILYEIFTGNRAYDTNNIAELKQLHASGSIATPSSLAHDVDPAVERLVQACLERDPQQRPPSAYAVLGALPGADPLAAALAAGETPSPELVAHAGATGGLRPRVAVAMGVVILALFGVGIGVNSERDAMFGESPQVLSLRAQEVLETVDFGDLPRFSSMGFGVREDLVELLGEDGTPATPDEIRGSGTTYFWKRWSPRRLHSISIHEPGVRINNPPQYAPGSATVVLDVSGRLLGLEVVPRQREDDQDFGAEPINPDWSSLLEAAGFDPAELTSTAPSDLPPTYCDTTVAWKGKMPGTPHLPVTIQAGSYLGRPVHFALAGESGSSTEIISSDPRLEGPLMWFVLIVFNALPMTAALILARRNLKLGRGDRKGATRLAVFVLFLYLANGAFTMRLSEGILFPLMNLIGGESMGHALIHSVMIWFFYMALEPYVRRLWPRMLVSWARVASGRVRDPLVGRDVLIGGLIAMVGIAFAAALFYLAKMTGQYTRPSVPGPEELAALVDLKGMASGIATGFGAAVLQSMGALVLAFLFHLLTRRVWAAILLGGILMFAGPFLFLGQVLGFVIGGMMSVVFVTMTFLSLFRFGLLTSFSTLSVFWITITIPFTSDLSNWYAGNMILGLGVLLAILGFAFYTSLAGQPIFRDVLQDRA